MSRSFLYDGQIYHATTTFAEDHPSAGWSCKHHQMGDSHIWGTDCNHKKYLGKKPQVVFVAAIIGLSVAEKITKIY